MISITRKILAISIFATHVAHAQIAECDRLASSPLDPQKQSVGVTFNKLEHIAAVTACKLAIAESRQVPRLWFQYGRALEKANKLPDAIVAYQEAAKLGSGAAYNNIGELYRDGKGFGIDLNLAEEFFKKAADRNSTEGRDNLMSLQMKTKQGNLKSELESSNFLYEVQLAAFKTKDEATIKISELSKIKIFAYISVASDDSIFRVRRGPFISLQDANNDVDYLASIGLKTNVIQLPSNQDLQSLIVPNNFRITKEHSEYLQRKQTVERSRSIDEESKGVNADGGGLYKLEAFNVKSSSYASKSQWRSILNLTVNYQFSPQETWVSNTIMYVDPQSIRDVDLKIKEAVFKNQDLKTKDMEIKKIQLNCQAKTFKIIEGQNWKITLEKTDRKVDQQTGSVIERKLPESMDLGKYIAATAWKLVEDEKTYALYDSRRYFEAICLNDFSLQYKNETTK